MVNVDDVYGNLDGRPRFLKADLCTEMKLWNNEMVIDKWEVKEFENFRDDGTKYVDKKIALTFQPVTIEKNGEFEEFTGMLVLNMTNKDIIKEAYGSETDEWVGKPVKLLKVKRKYQNKLVDAMQVDIPEKDVPEDVGGEPSSSSTNDDPFSLSAAEYVNTLVNRFLEADETITKNVLFNQARDELLSVDAEFLGDVAREIDRRDYP